MQKFTGLSSKLKGDCGFVPEQVRLLKAAGAVVLAKANMAEWAFDPDISIGSAFGVVRNPYDLDHVTAGSSGGTAAGALCLCKQTHAFLRICECTRVDPAVGLCMHACIKSSKLQIQHSGRESSLLYLSHHVHKQGCASAPMTSLTIPAVSAVVISTCK